MCVARTSNSRALRGEMRDPNLLREQAKRCRNLSKTAIEPEVIEQLRVWAVELAEEAEQIDWSADGYEVITVSD